MNEDLEGRIYPEEPDDFCVNKGGAESQRKNERARGLGDVGTMSFEQTGCYSCPGYKKDCPKYEANL